MREIRVLKHSLKKVTKTIENYGNLCLTDQSSDSKIAFLRFNNLVLTYKPNKIFKLPIYWFAFIALVSAFFLFTLFK